MKTYLCNPFDRTVQEVNILRFVGKDFVLVEDAVLKIQRVEERRFITDQNALDDGLNLLLFHSFFVPMSILNKDRIWSQLCDSTPYQKS